MNRPNNFPGALTIREAIVLLALAIALGLGLSFATPAHGETLGESTSTSSSGSIEGLVTLNGAAAAGINVELRQRTNGGADSLLSTATTDASGQYTFPRQPSAPGDAFYYIRFSGGSGTLAAWYTFPIIYVSGSDFTVPPVEVADVTLLEPANGATVSLPATLKWKVRRAGETYRVFVYPAGSNDKPALDSGSLGMSAEYQIAEGALAAGAYRAVVQVRDAVTGYGQSQAYFSFVIGVQSQSSKPAATAPINNPSEATSEPATATPEPPVPTATTAEATVEPTTPPAPPTDTAVPATPISDATSTTVIAPTIPPTIAEPTIEQATVEATATQEVPAVQPTATPAAVQATVTQAPVQPTATTATSVSGGAVAPTARTGTSSGSGSAGGSTSTKQVRPTPTPVRQQTASMPQTGGGFPVVFAVLLVAFTLLARYLRGRSHRRI